VQVLDCCIHVRLHSAAFCTDKQQSTWAPIVFWGLRHLLVQHLACVLHRGVVLP
jgi:hypothetical protein